MAKFRRKNAGKMAAIPTSSLPDVIFMILFFFMTVTSLRDSEALVMVRTPTASEVDKLERKDVTSYIFIGTPMEQHQALMGTDARIQLNDAFKNINDIRDFVVSERDKLSEADRQAMTIALKVDEKVRMGIVTDVKQELRRCSALRVHYSTKKGEHN